MSFAIRFLRDQSVNNPFFGMSETIEVIRTTRVSDGEGGFNMEPAPVATYPGRYKTAGARELEIASHLANSVDGVVTVPYDSEILETDTLRRVEEDVTYNVSGILSQTTELSADLSVLVRRA